MELTDEERAEIARLIEEGNTSGRIDGEDEKGNTIYVAWELSTVKWKDK